MTMRSYDPDAEPVTVDLGGDASECTDGAFLARCLSAAVEAIAGHPDEDAILEQFRTGAVGVMVTSIGMRLVPLAGMDN